MFEEELVHYGVPGMKWGVRKAREVGSRIKGNVASRRARNDAAMASGLDSVAKTLSGLPGGGTANDKRIAELAKGMAAELRNPTPKSRDRKYDLKVASALGRVGDAMLAEKAATKFDRKVGKFLKDMQKSIVNPPKPQSPAERKAAITKKRTKTKKLLKLIGKTTLGLSANYAGVAVALSGAATLNPLGIFAGMAIGSGLAGAGNRFANKAVREYEKP